MTFSAHLRTALEHVAVLLPSETIGSGPNGPMMTKYRLLGGLKDAPALQLHRFYRDDADAEPHTHPWRAGASLILLGGYVEEILVRIERSPRVSDGERLVTRRVERRPGRVNFVGASRVHRVEVTRDTAARSSAGRSFCAARCAMPGASSTDAPASGSRATCSSRRRRAARRYAARASTRRPSPRGSRLARTCRWSARFLRTSSGTTTVRAPLLGAIRFRRSERSERCVGPEARSGSNLRATTTANPSSQAQFAMN